MKDAMTQYYDYNSHNNEHYNTYRGEEEKALYLCGPMEMEVIMMTIVLLMAMPSVSTPYLLVHCLCMDTSAHLMNPALQKWSLHMSPLQLEVEQW